MRRHFENYSRRKVRGDSAPQTFDSFDVMISTNGQIFEQNTWATLEHTEI